MGHTVNTKILYVSQNINVEFFHARKYIAFRLSFNHMN